MNKRSDDRCSPGEIVIIGSGFGGLCMAIALKQAGIESFVILEQAASLGGTWRDNAYPGAGCDVQSHLYSYSFEPKPDWSRKFAGQAEIRAYLEHCADRYRLRAHIRLNTAVVSAVFDAQQGRWQLETADEQTCTAAIVITACGQLNRPAYPAIDGRDRFAGAAFHSARWDHDVELAGKRVAVIGTGASAIQFVPQIVSVVENLTLFQRSGAWVLSKGDREFSAREKRLFRRFPLLDRIYRTFIYWKNESRALAFTRFDWILELFALQARWMAWRQVRDPAKRRALIPDYKIGCKRVLLSNDWYPALDRDHVELVTDHIERIEADAIISADGCRHAVDVIIYGTGFHATEFLAPMRITGVGGRDLNSLWAEGAEAYKGISVAGFPNLFMLYGPNTNLAHNSIVFMLESQVRYVMQCIRILQRGDIASMDVRPERQRAYCDRIYRKLANTVWEAGCTSWYRTASGRNTNNWPDFTFVFRRMAARLELDDYHVEPTQQRAGDS